MDFLRECRLVIVGFCGAVVAILVVTDTLRGYIAAVFAIVTNSSIIEKVET